MKPDYGIDAPEVIRALFVVAIACALLEIVPRAFQLELRVHLPLVVALGCTAAGFAMLGYSKAGKLRHRDRLLALAELGAGMTVLDVGTGRGLLAIGAARTAGVKAIGVDVFAAKDLSDNSLEKTLATVAAESVPGVEIRSEDARKTTLADASVDRVLSNRCLHSVGDRAEREKALAEIVRVLRPGGRAVLSDSRYVGESAAYLAARGFAVSRHGPYVVDTFPPLSAIVATKPGAV